jgi:outer membrane protein OmpA-like peptidoglycan-associated protein
MIPFTGQHKAPSSGPVRSWARAEREADHVADAVLDNDIPAGHRPNADVPQTGTAAVPGVGQPLDPVQRAFFERRLGTDLASVRLHTGSAADQAARDEHANAYTVGEHVVLGGDADNATLAHELVHVLQQRGAGRSAVQRDEKTRTDGIGRTPPKVDFDRVDERPSGEDARMLFPHDSVSLSATDLETVIRRLPKSRRLVIDIDGYASTEGDAEYNVNLSAHRAAVLREVLQRLLPESEVHVHAHGATAAFGDPAANRRVGIRFTEAPVQLVPPLSTGGLKPDRRPRLLPEQHLHLDPGLLPSGTFPPSLDLRLDDPALGSPGKAAAQGPPQLFPPRLPELPPPGPVGPAQLFPRTIPPTRPVVVWGDMHQVATDNGIGGPIDQNTAQALEEHATRWYEFFRERGLTDDQARSVANLATRSMFGRELIRLNSTPIDESNNDLVRQGGSVFLTPTIDLLKTPEYYRALRKFLKGL